MADTSKHDSLEAENARLRSRLKQLEAVLGEGHGDSVGDIFTSHHKQVRVLEAVVSTTPGFVYLFDIYGRFQYANRRLLEVLGMTLDQVIGRTCLEVGYEQWHHDMHMREIAQVVKTKQPVKGETPFEASRTQLLGIYEYIFTPVLNSAGEVELIGATTRDITAKKQAEEAVLELQRKLNSALLAGEAGTFEWDIIKDRLWGDSNFAQIFAIERDATGAAPLAKFVDAIHPDDRAIVLEKVKRTVETGCDYRAEYRIVLGGQTRWVVARGKGERDGTGRVVRFPGVLVDITDRKLAEEELLRQREWLQVTLSSIGDAVIATDTESRVTFLNPVAEELTGWNGKEAIGQPLAEVFNIINEQTRQPAFNPVSKVLRDGVIVGLANHTTLISKKGEEIAIEDSAAPIRDPNGAITGVVMVFHDVTPKRRAEAALRQTAERLRLALAAGQLGDWHWDAATDLVTLSVQAARIFSLPEDQPITWTDMRLLLHQDDRERARIAVESALETRTDYAIEYRVRVGTEYRWISARGRGDYENDRVVGMTGVVQDVTERRRAAEALQEETRILEILNDTGKIIASNLDLQALVQSVTDAGTTLSGAKFGAFFYTTKDERGEAYTLYALSGAPREAFDKFGLPRSTPLFAPTFNGEGVIRSPDILKDPRYGKMGPHFGMPPGHLPVRSYLAVPVISRSGEVLGGLFFGHPLPNMFTERVERLILGISGQAATAIDNARLYEAAQREITDRKRAEQEMKNAKEEAERANRAKDEFLAIVSHELRTPLTAMLGWARMLKNGSLDQQQTVHGISVIERNVAVQTQLIEDLLDVSRMITGKLSLTIGPTDVLKSVNAAVESVRVAAEAKQIKIAVINETPIPMIAGDSGRLQQVFWNLLSNAVKFTPKSGCIMVNVVQVDSTVRVSVADNGMGIRKEFMGHMFQRFRQDDTGSTRKFGGLGLGLAIVRYLVEQHGGTVSAASEGEGKGSTFTVELPIPAVLDTSSVTTSAPIAPARKLSGVRVLIVEDEIDSRDLVTVVLKNAGAVTRAVASVDDAFIALENELPDVIVSDIGMPSKDGYELVRALRKLPDRRARVPVLALTAYAREEDRIRALSAGFTSHIAKPIDPQELIRRVSHVIADNPAASAG
ncbi:MAG TPA: PAS domain S-box protein [Planctomycetota bacterium]|nr:PAS domain S-box protein [Planctomycetota bacterium]